MPDRPIAADGKPVAYSHARGMRFAKLKEAPADHGPGDHGPGDLTRTRRLADDGFGRRDAVFLHEVPLAARPPGERIEADGRLVATAEDGEPLAFPITDIRDGAVHLDGNSPLAGQTPIFEVQIREIRTPTGPEQTPARPAF